MYNLGNSILSRNAGFRGCFEDVSSVTITGNLNAYNSCQLQHFYITVLWRAMRRDLVRCDNWLHKTQILFRWNCLVWPRCRKQNKEKCKIIYENQRDPYYGFGHWAQCFFCIREYLVGLFIAVHGYRERKYRRNIRFYFFNAIAEHLDFKPVSSFEGNDHDLYSF